MKRPKKKVDLQCLYVGVQGSGKTYKMINDVKKIIKKYQTKIDGEKNRYYINPKVLIFDPFREWTIQDQDEKKVDICGLPVLPLSEDNFETYPFLGTADKDQFLTYAKISTNTLIVVEELLNFDRGDFVELRRISSARRHNGNILFSSTQRPSHLPLILISSCTDIFAFKIMSKEDQKKLKSFSNWDSENVNLALLDTGNCVNLIR